MIQSNDELLSQPESGKRKGNYTGERLKVLRPETYRRVVELLAEPREHVSIREICRQCHVTDDTVKAVERREAISIAARKQELAVQAARIAKRAYDRVEDQIDTATLPQAVVTSGVFTDKVALTFGRCGRPTNAERQHPACRHCGTIPEVARRDSSEGRAGKKGRGQCDAPATGATKWRDDC